MLVVLYVFFYVFAIAIDQSTRKTREAVLFVACVVLAVLAGSRDVSRWPDTMVYISSFVKNTPSLFELTKESKPWGYSEMGFYYLGCIVKVFTSNSTLYLIFISALTFVFLYKDFKKYCIYPLFGLCAYVARFYSGRNLIQIRAGLSYAIILWAVQYIAKRDWKRYFLWVFIGYLFHQSALIAVPLYFLCLIKFKRSYIVTGIIIAFIIAGFFSGTVKAIVGDTSRDLNVGTAYLDAYYMREQGLANPMIYFQTVILLLYTFGEKALRRTTPTYDVIRTAYFYSTFILISLSVYTTLSGRTSSMFATLEMVIIPSLINAFAKDSRWLAYGGIGVVLSVFFYLNFR